METKTGVLKFSHQIGKPRSVVLSVGLIRRFKSFIEETDWDKDLVKLEKWIKLICWNVIVVSVLFFVPVGISALWK